ncbi:MAG: hypothetical protein AB1689_29195, partial [Thermodesulfobacteriota bacterium]
VAQARAAVAALCDCATAASHGDYVQCARNVATLRVANGLLPKSCKASVIRCAARSTCGKPGFVTCCTRDRRNVTRCSLKRDAALCRAPRGGQACVKTQPSCCDACPAGSCGGPTATPSPTPSPRPTSSPGPTGSPGVGSCEQIGGPTFADVQDRIFTQRGCTLSTCHGEFASGGLDLRPGSSHLELVDVTPQNPAAAAAGKKRVAPGDLDESFLSQKLHADLAPGEGLPMPLIGPLLPQAEVDLVDAWILAGAPATGIIPGAHCLPPLQYEPTQAPPPPPGGFQLVLDGPVLQPGQEQEGCLWIQAPNATDFVVGKWEFHLNPGTHHFALFEYNHPGAPATGVWTPGDVGCISGSNFGDTISGSPQAPYFIDVFPPGIGRILRAGSYIGMNAHYFNPYDVPLQIKVWTNIYPYEGTPQHIGQTIIEFDDMFDIYVPPFTQRLETGVFTNTMGKAMHVFQVTGHMHKRGLRFTAYEPDGTKLYENFDWSHPIFRHLDPPFVLQPGESIDFECLHDNGVTREVRRNANGDPVPLQFGLTTDDEMCTLNGQYYFVD